MAITTIKPTQQSSTQIDPWFSSSFNYQYSIDDGTYHRPDNTVPTMNRYGDLFKTEESSKSVLPESSEHVQDIPLAMSYEIISDYSKIPHSVYTDWKLIIQMNDKPGNYHNFISPMKRAQILLHINQWQKTNIR